VLRLEHCTLKNWPALVAVAKMEAITRDIKLLFFQSLDYDCREGFVEKLSVDLVFSG